MKTLLLGLLYSGVVSASTFVGNGGNAGDIEMQVSLKEIKEVMKAILKAEPDEKLCTCAEDFQGHPVCESLNEMSKEQVSSCEAFVRQQAPLILQLLEADDPLVTWTHDPIEVGEEGRLRAADAVANPDKPIIIVNQQRFLDLKPFERLFLLAHESHHLVRWNNHLVKDDESIGPFKGREGGRQLLNAAAAAAVQVAAENGISSKYYGILKRSQGHKPWWVDLSAVSVSSGENSRTLFAMDKSSGGILSARYFFNDHFGFTFKIRSTTAKKDILTSISARETQTAESVGLAYRLFPFRDPLSFSGQSHFVFDANVERVDLKYDYNDPSISGSETANSTAFTTSATYYMPFQSGFWFFIGLEYLTHRYKFSNSLSNLETDKDQTYVNYGVSYGF